MYKRQPNSIPAHIPVKQSTSTNALLAAPPAHIPARQRTCTNELTAASVHRILPLTALAREHEHLQDAAPLQEGAALIAALVQRSGTLCRTRNAPIVKRCSAAAPLHPLSYSKFSQHPTIHIMSSLMRLLVKRADSVYDTAIYDAVCPPNFNVRFRFSTIASVRS